LFFDANDCNGKVLGGAGGDPCHDGGMAFLQQAERVGIQTFLLQLRLGY
jgi:hypothetical protein